jgi:hypothetical protein
MLSWSCHSVVLCWCDLHRAAFLGNYVRPPPMFGAPPGGRGPIGGGEFVQPPASSRIDPAQMPRPGHVHPQAEPQASWPGLRS